ncbi:hypothetical protein ACFLX5_01065 [Chloroflexota bacterium]
MQELKDYSGDLRSDLHANVSLDIFSKEAVIKHALETDKLLLCFGGCWNTLNRRMFGEEEATEMDREVWLERSAAQVVARLRKLFAIQGSDIASFLKFLQIEPLFAASRVEYHLEGDSLAMVTVPQCRALDYFERHGEAQLQKNACNLHASALARVALDFHPEMKVRPLKLPPRELTYGKEGTKRPPIACRREIRISDK